MPVSTRKPPIAYVGSTPACSRIVAVIAVDVVFPCVPAIAIVLREPVSSASIAPRVLMSMPRSSAATNSGLSCAIALDTMTRSGSRDVFGAVADRNRRAFAFERFDQFGTVNVGAADARAAREQQARDRTHADSADADKMIRCRSVIHVPHRSLRPIRRPVRA